MAKVYPPGAGDVEIVLGPENLVLKPTLAAGLAISRQAAGIRGAIDKVMALDLDMILTVIRVGIGPKEAKRYPNLDEMVFASGITSGQGMMLTRLVEYLTNLSRGGRPADDTEGEEDREPVSPQS